MLESTKLIRLLQHLLEVPLVNNVHLRGQTLAFYCRFVSRAEMAECANAQNCFGKMHFLRCYEILNQILKGVASNRF